MTDADIMKALECCADDSVIRCKECLYGVSIFSCRQMQLKKDSLDLINRQKAEIERMKTLAKLGNMRANDYRVMRDRALKAEAEVERLKEDVSFGQRTCKEWAEICDELTEKLNGAIAGQETLQKTLAEKNAEIEKLQADNSSMQSTLAKMSVGVEQAKAEAIKEFEEKLKDNMNDIPGMEYGSGDLYYLISKDFVDNLVKEMVGDAE